MWQVHGVRLDRRRAAGAAGHAGHLRLDSSPVCLGLTCHRRGCGRRGGWRGGGRGGRRRGRRCGRRAAAGRNRRALAACVRGELLGRTARQGSPRLQLGGVISEMLIRLPNMAGVRLHSLPRGASA
eukprot:gene16241-biopygen4158